LAFTSTFRIPNGFGKGIQNSVGLLKRAAPKVSGLLDFRPNCGSRVRYAGVNLFL
jgi:hypothetical protein